MSDAGKHTSLYEEHKKAGARFVPFAGFEMPIQYTGIVDEHVAVRTAAGVFDVSHMGELEMTGEYAAQVVNYLITNDASKLVDGQALYTCACNERGTILDDLIVYRASQERWLIVCNASNREKMVGVFRKAAENHCEFRDVSDETALIALQGPKAFDVLGKLGAESAKLSELEIVSLPRRDHREREVHRGAHGLHGRRRRRDLLRVERRAAALARARRARREAVRSRRARHAAPRSAPLALRKRHRRNDEPDRSGPRLGREAAEGRFRRRTALEEIKAAPLARKMVGFEMTGRGIARHGYPLRDESGAQIGICTSGSPGPTVGKNLGLGYLPTAKTELGTRFMVDCRGKNIEAVVVATPFYKRAK